MNDFTIIIPTYNNLELAEKAIHSVISQKDVTCKIVVTDDSTDNKIEILCEEINNDNLFYYHNIPPCLFLWYLSLIELSVFSKGHSPFLDLRCFI